MSVSHLADALRSCGSESEYTDGWVRDVGKAFQMADWMWSGSRFFPNLPIERLAALPALSAFATAMLLPILRVPDWLGGLFPSLPWLRPKEERVPPATWLRPEPERASGFGELLTKIEEEKAEAVLAPTPVKGRLLWWNEWWEDSKRDSERDSEDKVFQSQRHLEYEEGKKTVYGCTFTATSWILAYWKARDPTDETIKTMSAQELLNENKEVFQNSPMDIREISDEVNKLGFVMEKPRKWSTKDALKEAVANGPVIALVKEDLSTSKPVLTPTGKHSHAVVVTGISEDGQQVRIKDPWDGKSYTYSWDEFSASWGADFGKDKHGNDIPKNSFVVVRPLGGFGKILREAGTLDEAVPPSLRSQQRPTDSAN